MKKSLLKIFLFAVLFVTVLTFSAFAESYEEQFNSMELPELEAISETLSRIINEKKIGNAILIVEPAEATVARAKSVKLAVTSDERTVTPKTVLTYESSDENVAKVSKGVVTGVGEGKAEIKISAQFEDGAVLETTCTVNVFVPVTALKAQQKAIAFVGGELNLAETVSIAPEDATEKKLVWSIDDESVATIDENGVLKGLKGGTAKVTVESAQAEPAVKKIQIAVSVDEAVGSIKLDASSITVGKGKSQKLTPTVGPESATNKAVEWTSEDPSVAAVTTAGVVSGKSNGTTKIICTAKDGSGVTASAEVTVITSVTGLKMNKKMIILMKDESTTVGCDVLPKDATNKKLKWTSSNSGVLSVDSNGRITGNRAGTATLTATSESDSSKKASITVYVEPKNPVDVNTIHWQTTWGQKNGKVGISVVNLCSYHKIKSVTVKIECEGWYGGSSTDYETYSGLSVGPGKEGKTKLSSTSVSGFSTAVTVKITPISVTFEDGSEYYIPSSEQETAYFSM